MRTLHRLLLSVKSETSPLVAIHLFATRDAAVDIAYGAQFTNRSSVAALAILVYDILLTTDEEVRLIWPKRLSYTKLLYFFIRYFPVLVLISILFIGTEITPDFHFTPHDCFIWQVWQGVAALAVAAAVDIILVLRVYAMYGQSRVVLGVLVFAYLLEVCSMVASLILTLPKIEFDTICIVTSIPTTILIYGAASLLFQLTLFVLTTVKFVKGLGVGRGRTPLLTLLARDGTWAFGLIFLILAMQASLYALPEDKHGYIGMFYGWLLVVFSFCGYRILLNIQHLSPTLGDGRVPHGGHAPLPVTSSSGAGDSGVAFTSHIGVDSHILGAGGRSEIWRVDNTGGSGTGTGTESYEMLGIPSSNSTDRQGLRHVV